MGENSFQILIVTDIRLYREGLREILERQELIDVVGTAANATEALRKTEELKPDIVLLDTALPDRIAAVESIVTAVPEVKVVALAVPDLEDDVIVLAEAGVSGFVPRDGSLNELVASIETVSRGEVLLSSRMAAALLKRMMAVSSTQGASSGGPSQLTARELEILGLIDQGLSNREIAQKLVIEISTVKNHVHHILEKLNVRRRAEAAAELRRWKAEAKAQDLAAEKQSAA